MKAVYTMIDDPDVIRAHQILAHLFNGDGSLEEAEEWFIELHKLQGSRMDGNFYAIPEQMDNLEHIMAVRRRIKALNQSRDHTSENSHLVATIQSIIGMQLRSDTPRHDIDVVEFDACFGVLETAVPDAPWANLILKRKENIQPEEILAEGYKIQLNKLDTTIKL